MKYFKYNLNAKIYTFGCVLKPEAEEGAFQTKFLLTNGLRSDDTFFEHFLVSPRFKEFQ